jgi:ABC-2 type transport system ATP-binding protein
MTHAVRQGTARRAEMPAAVSVDGVSKSFGETRALVDVSFSVSRGEVFGLLGPNGAGKTTLLEILEGHGVPDSGAVSVLGMTPRTAGPRLRDRLGVVPQTASFEMYLTVREHLRAFGNYYARNYPVDALIDLVGLNEKAGTLVGRLSGGQQRRLDLALALVGDPDVVFLDEPTTGFDVDARDQAWEVVAQLRDAGKTVILSTHNMAEAQALADRVAVIDRGEVAATGAPAELLGDDRARVSFRGDESLLSTLPDDLAKGARVSCGEVVLLRRDGVATVRAVLAWSDRTGVPLAGLRVERPSLEDLYVAVLADHHSE